MKMITELAHILTLCWPVHRRHTIIQYKDPHPTMFSKTSLPKQSKYRFLESGNMVPIGENGLLTWGHMAGLGCPPHNTITRFCHPIRSNT